MALGEKLSRLRRDNNYTQEQLAEILGVSRQAVSKWESDISYPETDKLIKLGELFNCSIDYLLKDNEDKPSYVQKKSTFVYEKVSEKTFHGIPLLHINIGYGRTAHGIIAIGLAARGVISIGVFSVGLFSLGVFALGLLALGSFALGALSFGAISCGVIAFGAISVGIISVGALSVGLFSVGASASGKYFAWGDHSSAMIAFGKTKAVGSVFQKTGELTPSDIEAVRGLLDERVPSYLAWAKSLIKLMIL